MVSRIFSFITWALCAMGIAYWGMTWLASPLPVPAHAVLAGLSGMPASDPRRLLSLSEQALAREEPTVSQSAISQRVQLIGLMAGTPQHPHAGIALLTVDGKPAKAYRVGQAIGSEWVVLSIAKQGVSIGMPGDTEGVTLAAQSLPAPNTGSLPALSSDTNPTVPIPPEEAMQNQRNERNRSFVRPDGFQS